MDSNEFLPRRFHTAVAHGNKIYVFGGCFDEYVFDNMNQVWEFDFSNFVEKGEKLIRPTPIRTKGDLPSARWGHSASIREGKMYIFGGRNQEDLNDFYRFDIEEREWTHLQTQNDPEP